MSKQHRSLSPEKLRQDEEIKNMFHKIDADSSGILELGEIYQLFKASGILISKEQIKSLFLSKNSTKLSLDEFLKISKDENYRAKFRQVMRDIKMNIKLRKFHGYKENGNNKTDFNLGRVFILTKTSRSYK